MPHVGHLYTWEGDIRKPSKSDRDQLGLRYMHRGILVLRSTFKKFSKRLADLPSVFAAVHPPLN